MQERRSHKRYTVDNLNIRGNILFISDIEIVNISLNGIAIRCDRRIDLNRRYNLNLSYEGKKISLNGHVVWSMITGSRLNSIGEMVPIYTAGIEFVDVLSEKMSELVEFIESHRIEGEKRLSGVRFHIKSPDAAKLDYPYNYRVKKISLSGMLVESTQPFEVGERFPV
ncbi:MAG: PilZ domain-containing protein, partial [Thermodesulfovibrionales bacterium]